MNHQETPNRRLMPAGMPLAVAVIAATLAFAFSRILLTLDEAVAPVMALGVAVAILGISTLLAVAPGEESFVLGILGGIGAAAIIVVGAIAAFNGDYPTEGGVIFGGVAAAIILLMTLTPAGEPNEVEQAEDRGLPKRPVIGGVLLGLLLLGIIAYGTRQELNAPEDVVASVTPAATASSVPTIPPGGSLALDISTPDDTRFDKNELTAPAGTPITVNYTNNSDIPHNIHFFAGADANAPSLGMSEIGTGPNKVLSVSFTTPAEGTYYFQCDIHPTQMSGKLTVSGAAPSQPSATPGPSGSPAPGGATTLTLATHDNSFDPNQLTGKAGQTVTIQVTNQGQAIHNFHVTDANVTSDFIQPGSTVSVEVKLPDSPGTLNFVCDVHPTEMTGTIKVE